MSGWRGHPHLSATRGSIGYWNFLPPEELDSLLNLYNRVNREALVISSTFGIEGRKLPTPDDEFDPIKELNEQYEGAENESEALRLEYEELVLLHPDFAAELPHLPLKIFSGKNRQLLTSAPSFSVSGFPIPIHHSLDHAGLSKLRENSKNGSSKPTSTSFKTPLASPRCSNAESSFHEFTLGNFVYKKQTTIHLL